MFECQYCDETFATEAECDEHENDCTMNPAVGTDDDDE